MTRCDMCRAGAIRVHDLTRDQALAAIGVMAGRLGTGTILAAKTALLNEKTHHEGHRATCQHEQGATVTALWHYTCDHGYQGIQRDGLIRPNLHPALDVELAWFTDLIPPDRDALGLTSQTLPCDRTLWRYPVDGAPLMRWTTYRRSLIQCGRKGGVLFLESAPGAMPAHWWVSEDSVPAGPVVAGRAAA